MGKTPEVIKESKIREERRGRWDGRKGEEMCEERSGKGELRAETEHRPLICSEWVSSSLQHRCQIWGWHL